MANIKLKLKIQVPYLHQITPPFVITLRPGTETHPQITILWQMERKKNVSENQGPPLLNHPTPLS